MRALVIFLALSACLPDETISGYADRDAVYRLSEIDGAAFSARATIAFPRKGHVAGQAPCNRFQGEQTAPYPWFATRDLAVTRRACPELTAEAAFLQALTTMTLAEVSGDTLILSNDAGREMVFTRSAGD